MNITEILAKIAKGVELTEQEKAFCSVYQVPKDEPPKGRVDPKIKELEEKLKAEQAEKAELAKKVEEAENANLTELELTKKKLEEATGKISELSTANGNLKSTLDGQTFDINLNKLAAKHNCNDLDYLKFKIQGQKDFDFEKGGDDFMEQFKTNSPQYFNAEIKGGGGGSNPTPGSGANPDKFSELDNKDEISVGELAQYLESLENNE
ncbi:hypothetical protein AAEX28_04135 [Lentisphaerota bacterium WC36G]|nr:hypothetical protein LJT99_07005 [Lentisphaerae bacterium WC36]